MDQQIINGSMKALLKAQQGELDAVLMYKKLAEVVNEQDAVVFRQLAAEEGGGTPLSSTTIQKLFWSRRKQSPS